MDHTQDDALRSPSESVPQIPHPYSLELTDDEIRRLQEILNRAGGEQFNFVQAKYHSLELLRLVLMLIDPERYAFNLEHPLLPPEMRQWCDAVSSVLL